MHEKRIHWREIVKGLQSEGENVPANDEIYSFYFKELPAFYDEFYKAFISSYSIDQYTKLLQTIGDNIRASGEAFSHEINSNCILYLSQRVNMLIKILRRRNLKAKGRVLVVIDALRNPYEATFFKDRYIGTG